MSTETQTPAETLAKATQENVLAMRDMTLVGTITGADQPTALIRMRQGDIRRVAPGDRLGAATVLTIGAGSVILQRAGRTERLDLPNG